MSGIESGRRSRKLTGFQPWVAHRIKMAYICQSSIFSMGPLSNLRVIDVSRLLPGGFCTMVLADLGATVIKVEQPGVGDYMRLAPPFVDGVSPFHLSVNKNKKSLAIDLKKSEGRAILRKLVKESDVFVEAYRPGVMKRLGLDYESLRKINRRLIYCSLSAFGQKERLSLQPAHDLNFQGMSGIFSYAKRPPFPSVQLADMISGLYASIGILAALNLKPRKAVHLDVPITQCLTSLLVLHLGRYLSNSRFGFEGLLYGKEPFYRFYKTKDGKFLSVAAIEEKFRRNLLKQLGLEMSDNYLQTKTARKAISKKLSDIFISKTRDDWMAILGEKETCVMPVLEIGEVLSQPWSVAVFDRDLKVFITPLIEENSKRTKIIPSPTLGKDTFTILQQLGYKTEDIESLKCKGIVQY